MIVHRISVADTLCKTISVGFSGKSLFHLPLTPKKIANCFSGEIYLFCKCFRLQRFESFDIVCQENLYPKPGYPPKSLKVGTREL
jgi:hypothetical protein